MQKYLILVAGGRGTRMKADQPKQFLRIGRYPVLYYSMRAFYDYDNSIKIILVLPSDMITAWENIVSETGIRIPHQIIEGGNTRMESCRNGMSMVGDDGLVAVHDAVRPLVSRATIDRCFNVASEKGNAVPVGEIYETLRQLNSSGSVTIDRNFIRSVQTPQVFQVNIIKKAFDKVNNYSYTDEASMIESLGYPINMVEGNRENIKITDPYDLKIAEFLLQGKI
jgi:2-C-methyl-D-erythritol 4-phosphate cytidylyltransferase